MLNREEHRCLIANPSWAAEHTNTFPGWEFFVPLVEPHAHTLFSLLERPVLIWDEFLDRRAQIAPTLESLAASFEEVRDIAPPRPEPREVYLTEAEFLQALEGVAQISLKELGLENLAPAPETASQAIVIGGDLYFPPEGAKSSEQWTVNSDAQAAHKSNDEWRVTTNKQAVPSPDDAILPAPVLSPQPPAPVLPSPDFSSGAQDDSGFEDRKWPDGLSLESRVPYPEFPLLSQPPPKYQGRVKDLAEDLRVRVKRGESVIFVVPTIGKVDRLREILKDYEIPFDRVIERSGDRVNKSQPTSQASSVHPVIGSSDHPITRSADSFGVLIARGEIREGVAFPELKQLWLADGDLFGGFDWGSRGRRERSGISSFISDLSDLKVGDYVVHIDHGIGIYQGLRQLSVAGAARDFMLLTFQDEAKLYVPLERLDLEQYVTCFD